MEGKLLTEGTPWKKILVFAFPVCAGILLQQLYSTADSIIVGNFESQTALSAVGTTTFFSLLFIAMANGFSNGAGVIVAQHYGANHPVEVRKNAARSIAFILILGVVCMGIGILVSHWVLKVLLNVQGDMLVQADMYFKIYCLGLIFLFGYTIVSSILRAIGDSKASLYFLLISSLLNIALDVVFVACLHWGVVGAAIATDISQVACCIAAFVYMRKKYTMFRFSLKDIRLDAEVTKNVVRIGFPMALQMSIVSVGMSSIQRLVNSYGDSMTASFTVACRLENYVNMPCNAFMTTMATYVGQNMGSGRIDRVKTGLKQTIIMNIIITVSIGAVMWIFARPLIAFFGISGQATEYCLMHIRTLTELLVIFSAYFPLLGLFQGSGDGFAAMTAALTALGVRVVAAYVLYRIPAIGYHIIWWNCLFGWVAAFAYSWTHYFRGSWQKKKVIEK